MIIKKSFLLIALIVAPNVVFGEDLNIGQIKSTILNATSITDAYEKLTAAKTQLDNSDKYKDVEIKTEAQDKIDAAIKEATKDAAPSDTRTAEEKAEALQQLEDDYEAKKANEQSLANRTLTAVTTAATGIGGMELAMGLSEQKADREADQAMDALIATMRCSYGDGKQVKAGPDEIELPGGNNADLMKYRTEYMSLAADLKERKNALGMKPGIEAEEILDKASMGLYDDENVGITDGAYGSLYRAKMLGSEKDQAKIDADKEASSKRVKGGAIAAGAGALVGIGGNMLINGTLSEKIKELKDKKTSTKENDTIIKSWKQCLDKTGMKNVDKLDLSSFDMTGTKETLDSLKCDEYDLSGKDALIDIDTKNGETGLGNSLGLLFSQSNQKKPLSSVKSDEKRIDTSENGGNEVLKDEEGTCFKRILLDDGEQMFETSENDADCAHLNKNEFSTQFSYGTIKGTALCSETPEKEQTNGTPSSNHGDYCWCKLNDDKFPNANWMFRFYFNDPDPDLRCSSYMCLRFCAEDTSDDEEYRKVMFGYSDK